MAPVRETDVLVIGGGINGAGIARDVAGRGLSVVLCEKNDLASATSSASSKMIHGGLRYLEHYAFGLVRKALHEREVLLKAAPHIIWPMTFCLPHHKKLRPWWMIRLGLFFYDHMGGRKILPSSSGKFLLGTHFGQPLKNVYKRGFVYTDCWVEDTRLVVVTAMDAQERGAEILTRTECLSIVADGDAWLATLKNTTTDEETTVRARMVVNAAGPWVDETLGRAVDVPAQHKIRWVKGSHIIVPRLYPGDHCYLLQNDDKRVVFVFPYEKKYSLIGTTDVDYDGSLEEIRIGIEEVEYLCDAVNGFFRQQLKPEDVQWTYSGVRPLVDDGATSAQEATRDYVLDVAEKDNLPIMSVYGGKLTTYRVLSEEAGNIIAEKMGATAPAWTAAATLPGGEGAGGNFDTFIKTMKREYNWLPDPLAQRYARAYGARARQFLRGCKRMTDLGAHLGDGVYEAEIRYLVAAEFAMTSEDILWRRSKLGLHTAEETQNNIRKLLRIIFAEA